MKETTTKLTSDLIQTSQIQISSKLNDLEENYVTWRKDQEQQLKQFSQIKTCSSQLSNYNQGSV